MSGWSGTVVLAALWWAMPPGAPQQAGEAAARVPASAQGCPAGLLDELDHAVGTPVYRSVHREIAVLRLGHEGSERLQTALAPAPGAASPAKRQIVQVMTGMDKARDAYLCGAWVAGNGGATTVDALMRERVGPVFERMAEEVSRLENSVVTQAAGRPAESTATILEERRKTDAELLDGVEKSEDAVVDGDRLRVTCMERGRLMSEIAEWSKAGRDEFTVAAGLMEEFLRIHQRCAAA